MSGKSVENATKAEVNALVHTLRRARKQAHDLQPFLKKQGVDPRIIEGFTLCEDTLFQLIESFERLQQM